MDRNKLLMDSRQPCSKPSRCRQSQAFNTSVALIRRNAGNGLCAERKVAVSASECHNQSSQVL